MLPGNINDVWDNVFSAGSAAQQLPFTGHYDWDRNIARKPCLVQAPVQAAFPGNRSGVETFLSPDTFAGYVLLSRKKVRKTGKMLSGTLDSPPGPQPKKS
jgi:hypothetical protein